MLGLASPAHPCARTPQLPADLNCRQPTAAPRSVFPISVSLGDSCYARKPTWLVGAGKTQAQGFGPTLPCRGSSSLQCHCCASREPTHGFNIRTEGTLLTKVEKGRHGKALLPEVCSVPGLWVGWHLQNEAPAQGHSHTSLKGINMAHQKQSPCQLHKFCMGQEQNPVCLVLPGLCVMLPIKCLAK